ncbi:MAG: DUF438 domain-containing protein [Thermofilum sp.]
MEAQKIELVKSLLRRLHEGANVEELKREFRQVLSTVQPWEIPLIEQQLVKEGVPISEILKLCDLHVDLFREYLAGRELREVPEGHPLDLLLKENELLLKLSEQLSVVAGALQSARDEELKPLFEQMKALLRGLRGIRTHYRKVQMLIFPYLERRGIVAIPRVLWGREDGVIVKLRVLLKKVEGELSPSEVRMVAEEALKLAREVSELVFRENKILYPAVFTLFGEGEWAAIAEEAEKIGYLVKPERKWEPGAEPLLPYQVDPQISGEAVERLPPEFRETALLRLEPDVYQLKREGDLDLRTGFLTPGEVKGIFEALPIEVTFADASDRVRFYCDGRLPSVFVRTRTILGRRLLFCHPPRLERLVNETVEALKRGEADYREFWTRIGDRVVRVFISAVRDEGGNYLGAVEVVEDFTEVLKNPEEVLKKVVVL